MVLLLALNRPIQQLPGRVAQSVARLTQEPEIPADGQVDVRTTDGRTDGQTHGLPT